MVQMLAAQLYRGDAGQGVRGRNTKVSDPLVSQSANYPRKGYLYIALNARGAGRQRAIPVLFRGSSGLAG